MEPLGRVERLGAMSDPPPAATTWPPRPGAAMMRRMLRWFRIVALAEAVSYLVLLAAAVAKRALDAPARSRRSAPSTACSFLAYVGLAFAVRPILRWNPLTTAIVVVAAVIPFGAFVVERRLPDTEPEAEPAP